MGGSVAVAGVAALAAAVYAVRGRSSQVFGRSVHRGPADRPLVAFTFDDGPSPSTGALLETLNRRRARATFFQCGVHARRLQSVVAEVVNAGHEIANHTENHQALWRCTRSGVIEEITEAQTSLGEASGMAPRWFRPPYGVRWFGVAEAQARCSLTGAMWTCIGLDWRLPAAAIMRRLVQHAENGAIFCLHDGRELSHNPDISNTLEAVSETVPRIQDLGYQCVTLSEMFDGTGKPIG